MTNIWMAFDNETETHNKFKRKANMFIPENYIVERGWKRIGDRRNSWSYHKSKAEVQPIHIPDDVNILYGFNIKFDLLYEMCVPGGREVIMAFIKRGGKIWCGQLAEYLLRGQQEKYQMCAMDDIIEYYGGRKKIDGIKELWKAGVLTSEINPDLLTDYLVGTEEEDRNSGDIGNTILICEGQIKEAEASGMLVAIQRRMDSLLSTTEMEFNGLKIDMARAKADMAASMANQAELEKRLSEHIAFIPEEVGFNWGSGTQVSCLIFGGTIRYKKSAPYLDATGQLARLKATEWWPIIRGEPRPPAALLERGFVIQEDGSYKHPALDQDRFLSGKKKGEGKFKSVDVPGNIKTKIQDFFFTCPGFTEPDPEWKGAKTDGMGGPVYSTSSDVIEELGVRDIPFLKDFAARAKVVKDLGTYYARYDPKKKETVGMLTAVNPVDCIVHHSLNHTSTITTRLSSSNPNLQNVPRAGTSVVKAMFISRWGEDGRMVEIDYSQLEVVVQGWLSGDANLVRDLNNRIDFHCKRVAAKFGISYEQAVEYTKSDAFAEQFPEEHKMWKERRTGVKEFSFQRAYGAGAAAISAATGIPLEEVKELIINEDRMYPGINVFNDMVASEVNHTAEPFRDASKGFRMFRRGTYQAPTGTMYSFRSWDAPDFMRKQGITDTFSPPELKNYPIQGTGGEVVQLVLGLILRHFYKSDNYGGRALLVNTVHDCIWIDAHKDVYVQVAKETKAIMEGIPKYLKHFFNIDCPVPFPAEAEAGLNMLALKEHIH